MLLESNRYSIRLDRRTTLDEKRRSNETIGIQPVQGQPLALGSTLLPTSTHPSTRPLPQNRRLYSTNQIDSRHNTLLLETIQIGYILFLIGLYFGFVVILSTIIKYGLVIVFVGLVLLS